MISTVLNVGLVAVTATLSFNLPWPWLYTQLQYIATSDIVLVWVGTITGLDYWTLPNIYPVGSSVSKLTERISTLSFCSALNELYFAIWVSSVVQSSSPVQ